MTFAEKLNSMIALAGVSNVKIARALSIDASLVSRWRGGTRSPLNNPDMLKALAGFFAEQLESEYQRAMLEKLMESEWKVPLEGDGIQESIYLWMMQDTPAFSEVVERVKAASSGAGPGRRSGTAKPPLVGAEARKQAVHQFMHHWKDNSCEDGVLRLYSDENIDWMDYTTDCASSFLEREPELVKSVRRVHLVVPSSLGWQNLIRAIEFVTPFGEDAIVQIYGMDDAGYGGAYHHFFAVAPGVGTLSSASFNGVIPTSVFVQDEDYTHSAARQFDLLTEKCTPILTYRENLPLAQRNEELRHFIQVPGDTCYIGNLLPSTVLPSEVLEELLHMFDGTMGTAQECAREARAQTELIEGSLEQDKMLVCVPLHSPKDVESGAVSVPNVPRFVGNQVVITPRRYLAILQNIRQLCNRPNFLFQVIEELRHGYCVMVKPTCKLMILLNEPKIVSYLSDRPIATHAMYRHIGSRYEAVAREQKPEDSLRKLEEQIRLFEDYLTTQAPH